MMNSFCLRKKVLLYLCIVGNSINMVNKHFIFAVLSALFLAACSSAPKLDVSKLPPHHTADGRFRNTDTIGPLLLDTMHLEEAVKILIILLNRYH